VRQQQLSRLEDHYRFYGTDQGVRTARKHIIWYTRGLEGGAAFQACMNNIEDAGAQARAVAAFLDEQARGGERLRYAAQALH
jgi:tRNA-dihydrouridine synthase B